MLKSATLAVLLAIAPAAQVAAGPLISGVTAVPATAEAGMADQRCFDASNAGLSGTLQIDDRLHPADDAEPEHEYERAPTTPDCAVA